MSAVLAAMSGLAAVTTNRSAQESNQAVAVVSSPAAQNPADLLPTRSSRRATSHYNVFQTSCQPTMDDPPCYASVPKWRGDSDPISRYETERLPAYSCSVASEGKVWYQLESDSPLNGVTESCWKEVYAVLRGTLLQLHRLKDHGAGKLFRTYTLQHAEIGLATDTSYTVLVPQTRLAHLIPTSRRLRAWQKDCNLYKPSKQSLLRLRLETDQILFAHESEERIFQWINSLSAAIDIAPAIDERSIPRQCTVPRRRRRRNAQDSNDVENPALRAEQERIWRTMYPSFAERPAAEQPGLSPTVTEDAVTIESRQNAARDDEEIDIAMMREDLTTLSIQQSHTSALDGGRPMVSRQTSADTIASIAQHNLQTTPLSTRESDESTESGKWQPSHSRSSTQALRYIRRCMPILPIDAPRASDVLICHGRRVKVNWRMMLLEEWELKPPSYRSHKFDVGLSLVRTTSQSSTSDNAADRNKSDSQGTTSCNASCIEQVEPVEGANGTYELSKIQSRTTHAGAADIPSVIFCF